MHLTNYHAGVAAEGSVELSYERAGYACLHRRWRGKGGEIDLIFRAKDAIVFVEVKKAKTHDRAAERISPRQVTRILTAAEEFIGLNPEFAFHDLRCDAALVNAEGAVRIEEGAITH